jgi:hypothetical protein
MPKLKLNNETLSEVADKVFGDSLRFPEILDMNPNLDVFGDLLDLDDGVSIDIPEADQILSFAEPVLSEVSEALGGMGRYLEQASSTITSVSSHLPPQLKGYAQEALDAIGKVNGIKGEVEQYLDKGKSLASDKLREYEGQLVQLVPWLLEGK